MSHEGLSMFSMVVLSSIPSIMDDNVIIHDASILWNLGRSTQRITVDYAVLRKIVWVYLVQVQVHVP
jgi:hypothetical protein